ncbi:hypothetical protein GGR54DRAFT_637676 [Hypoxylon sp. NC1633]|nr:hypothetical protein GGR54DRAFT_637676 [Hypoxylon sp. NC1633]
MADRKYSYFSTTPSLDKAGEENATGVAPRARQNYTKAIIIGLVMGIVIGGAIGTGVAPSDQQFWVDGR